MNPETKRLKDLLAELGVPRNANTVSMMGVVHAAVHTVQGRRLVDGHADQIAARGYRVYIRSFSCGCYSSVRLTGTPHDAGVSRTVVTWCHDGSCDAEAEMPAQLAAADLED